MGVIVWIILIAIAVMGPGSSKSVWETDHTKQSNYGKRRK